MSGVLAVLEQRDGKLHKMALESLAASQLVASELGIPLFAALLGAGANDAAQAIAGYKLDGIHVIDPQLLATYTPDGYTLSLRQLIEKYQPSYVFFPHTYQVRDF